MSDKTKCPICQTPVGKETFKEVYASPYNNQEYKYYEFLKCDVHWWEPLKIIPEFYENEVFEDYVFFHEVVGKLQDRCKPFFTYFPAEVRGRLLDVGCGDGVFLKYAKQLGFEVWGIDFDRKSVDNVKRNLGIDTVFAMSVEEFYDYAKEKDLKFDVITFFEVLEHQDRPKEFLKMVKELLKDGGYVAGSVPNRERLFAEEVDWKDKYHWDFPLHHFLRFSESSLTKALQIKGFSEVKVYRLDFPFGELPRYIEKKLFGNIDALKRRLKALAIGDERKALAGENYELKEVL